MCGIAGYVGQGGAAVAAMVEALRHRGPDSRGTFTDAGIGLGCRRLAIVDRDGGDQPIPNEDGSVRVVFNGELYNHERLRDELREAGHRFTTDSDTEVIVHAYEEWGRGCVDRFRGMWAFALWDAGAEELVLARDPIGKKPLYVHHGDGRVRFGSEIKAILADGLEPGLDMRALRQFLAYGYSRAPDTLFTGVRKLRPGEVLVTDGDTVDSEVHRSFDPAREPAGIEEAGDRLRGILEQEVRDWTREGGDYGVFLSGGIDSSAVLALLSRMDHVDEVTAYTAAFPGSRFDETGHAERVADTLGADHAVVEVPEDAVEMLPEMVEQYDDLMADQACVPYYLLSERAAEDQKVAFTGAGGDELFAGYEHHRIMDLGDRYARRVPRRLRVLAPRMASLTPDRVLDRLFPYAGELGPEGIQRFGRYLDRLDDVPDAYEQINAMLTTDELEELLEDGAGAVVTEFPEPPVTRSIDGAMRRAMAYEQFEQLPEKNLMKADGTGMAHGLELRTPLLTRRTIELSAGLPDAMLRGGGGKRVLKRATRTLLPDEIRGRQKQRLLMPIHEWIRDRGWWTVEELDDRYGIPDVLDRDRVTAMVEGLDRAPLFYSRQLWNVANFVVWHDRYME